MSDRSPLDPHANRAGSLYGRCPASCRTPAFWRNHAPRRLVGPARGRLPRPLDVHRLRHLGGVPGRPLRLRAVPLAVLLAGAVRQLAARVVRAQAGVVAGLAAVLAGAADPPVSGVFRFTCYYYRGAYYKAFWADPPACAVGEPRKRYLGEATFPLILQNIHRYFLYVALVFLLFLAHDVWKALWFTDPATGAGVVRHRRRHARARDQRGPARRLHARLPLAAPPRRRLSRPALRPPGAPAGVRLRELPQPRATCAGRGPACSRSAFADLYVRLCSMGIWTDWRISLTEYQTFEHDVLVIGAGGAGLRAAIAASGAGVTVGLSASRCWARRTP